MMITVGGQSDGATNLQLFVFFCDFLRLKIVIVFWR